MKVSCSISIGLLYNHPLFKEVKSSWDDSDVLDKSKISYKISKIWWNTSVQVCPVTAFIGINALLSDTLGLKSPCHSTFGDAKGSTLNKIKYSF